MAETANAEDWHRRGFELFGRYTLRFVALIRSLDDAQATARVPGLDWTAAETAAHVCSLYRRLAVDPRRAPDQGALTRQNAEDITLIGTDLGAIADEIEARLATAEGLVDALSPEREFEFHLGQQVTLASGMGVLVGELLVHGDDIVRATGACWEPSGDDLEIVWRVTLPVLA
ncbi:MAG: maleylpyruvate isomerase N-terminal domain-containing protein, partial [Acidimicrobiia bacterium]